MSETTPRNPEADALRLVSTTVGAPAQAQDLARGALERGLAACVQILPVNSLYLWQGDLAQSQEQRIDFKTVASRHALLEAFLRTQHPYELPAIFSLPVLSAAPAYAHWVRSSLRPVQATADMSLLLSAQRALEGSAPERLLSYSVEWAGDLLRLRAVLAPDASDEDVEALSIAGAEIIADFPDARLDEALLRWDGQSSLTTLRYPVLVRRV